MCEQRGLGILHEAQGGTGLVAQEAWPAPQQGQAPSLTTWRVTVDVGHQHLPEPPTHTLL